MALTRKVTHEPCVSMPKITKRVVDAASKDPNGARYFIWDSDIRGFALLVLASGQKSYVFRYRTPEGRERQVTIGKHGAWTPDLSRRRAEEFRHAVSNGRDPLEERRRLRNAPTVAELLDLYVQSERFLAKADETRAIDRGRIERHLKPLLGRRHVHTLTTGEVERAFAAIRDGKTAADIKTRKRGRARVRGGEGAARMCIRLLKAVFGWAIGEKLASSNPCKNVAIGRDGTRSIVLEDAASYARLFSTLAIMEKERRMRPQVGDAIRLIAITGARRGEIAKLRWSHIDLSRGLITIPPRSHKTGRRTGKPRLIGLPMLGLEIIARQERGKPDDFVFEPGRGEGHIQLSKVWREVRKEAKLPEGAGLHALRHSIATHWALAGAGGPQLAALLGHAQISTVERYIHFAANVHQALANQAAETILTGVDRDLLTPIKFVESSNARRKERRWQIGF